MLESELAYKENEKKVPQKEILKPDETSSSMTDGGFKSWKNGRFEDESWKWVIPFFYSYNLGCSSYTL